MKMKMRLLYLVLFGVLVNSCDTIISPSSENNIEPGSLSDISGGQIGGSATVAVLESDLSVGAEVTTVSEYEDGYTTFTYTVKNIVSTGSNRTLTGFTLELPSCAGLLYSFVPGTPDGADYNEDESRISWNTTVPNPASNNTREFSITYEGEISSGMIAASIQRQGSTPETFFGTAEGPDCPGTSFTLSGSVYIDANENGIKDPEESGLGNIEVALSLLNDSGNPIETFLSMENGAYFFSIPAGSYTISVPENMVDNIYYKTSTTSIDVENVDSDVSGINFGYILDVENMVSDLLDGTILKNTKSWQYWAFQLRHAGNRNVVLRNPNVHYTADEIDELLGLVEGLLLTDPFQFGSDKRSAALNILTRPFGNEYDELLQQLLTAELNVLSNRGAYSLDNGEIILNNPFNRAILIYGEAIACNAIGNCPAEESGMSLMMSSMKITDISTTGTFSLSTLSSGKTLLTSFNGTGGIK